MKPLLILSLLILVSCATQSKSERLKSLGYTDIEIKKLDPYIDQYSKYLSSSFGATASLSGVGAVSKATTKLEAIYCACYRSHKDLCDGRLANFPDKEVVWLKANAAKVVNNSMATNSSMILTGSKTTEINGMMCE